VYNDHINHGDADMNTAALSKKLEKAQANYADAVASITLDELLNGVTCPIKAAKIDKAVNALGRIKSTIAVREEAAKLKAAFMDAAA
jgi:hypothetical protein